MGKEFGVYTAENDREGKDTLEVIAEADKFNRWMYRTIKPWCKGRILEIGSGIGNISTFFLNDGYEIMLTDIRDDYCDNLREKFNAYPNLIGVANINLTDPDFDTKFSELTGTFDTVFALNVVEHIEDDQLAIANCKKLLRPDGHLIILVPAYQSLYNGFDTALQHFRRYTKKTLSPLFEKNGLEVIRRQYFNFMGIFGWYVSGKWQKNDTIPGGQMKLYNLLVPVFKVIDKVLMHKAGLSVIVVGRKPLTSS